MMTGTVLTCYDFLGGIRGLIYSMVYKKGLCGIILKYGEGGEEATGFIDIDDRLREPVNGQLIHVAVNGLTRRLCPAVRGVVCVPYQSVGTSHGILPIVYINRTEVEREGRIYYVEKPLMAITKQNLSPSGEYQILIQKTDKGA